MASFTFEAMEGSGRTTTGTLDAESAREARAILRSKGLMPVEVTPLRQRQGFEGTDRPAPRFGLGVRAVTLKALFVRRPLRGRDLEGFSRNLSNLLKTGIPLERALEILGAEEPRRRVKHAILGAREQIQEGKSFGEALGRTRGFDDPFLVGAVTAGESSGTLAETLQTLADYLAKRAALREKLVGVLTYPLIVVLLGLGVLTFLTVKVLPNLATLFKGQHAALPLPTKILLGVSSFVSGHLALLVVVAVSLGASAVFVLSKPAVRRRASALLLHLPVLGVLLKKDAVGRFASAFSTLVGTGVPILQALKIASSQAGSALLKSDIEETLRRVEGGLSLTEALRAQNSPFFPGSVLAVISVGEETGDLASVTRELSEGALREVENLSRRLLDILQPALIVVLGLWIGLVVAAILLPLSSFAPL